MGALSFWYIWATGIRKKLINFTFKKRKIFRGDSNWHIFSFIFLGVANLKFNFLSHFCTFLRKSAQQKMGQFEPPPKIFLFLMMQFINFFYSYGSKVPKWKCAHILLCKKDKNCLKVLNIADLQHPDWIQRKKNTLYYNQYLLRLH